MRAHKTAITRRGMFQGIFGAGLVCLPDRDASGKESSVRVFLC